MPYGLHNISLSSNSQYYYYIRDKPNSRMECVGKATPIIEAQ